MIASFPMYDRTETRGHYAALWNGIRAAYAGDLPETLSYDTDLWDQWQSPELILSQTCGLPYRARLADHVTLVGTPDYGIKGCPPGYYNSVAVMRASDARGPDPARLRLAYNDPVSQSGWAAAVDHAGGCVFAGYLRTGSHAASARAVAQDRADIAYIDAVTWRMIERWDQGSFDLVAVARTDPTPGLPLITRGDGPAPELADAVTRAIADLATEVRAATGLQGLVVISSDAYLSLDLPPNPPH